MGYEAEGIIKGLIRIIEKEVAELYVEHFFQSQGIGAELIEFAIKEHDVKFLWVLEKNSNAIRFYEAHGFHITGNKMLEEGNVKSYGDFSGTRTRTLSYKNCNKIEFVPVPEE